MYLSGGKLRPREQFSLTGNDINQMNHTWHQVNMHMNTFTSLDDISASAECLRF